MHFFKSKRNWHVLTAAVILIAAGVLILTKIYPAFIPASGETSTYKHKTAYSSTSVSVAPSSSKPDSSSEPIPNIYSVNLNSPNAIMVRLSDNAVIMEKNSDKKIYPASLTKMMTAIVAIENLHSLDENITLSPSIFNALYKADASMAGFLPGEEVKAEDLLYGVLLPSGADCCVGLADHISGSESAFVEKMNEKAAQLGMENTHFENTTGLHDENHYTTVKDLSTLLAYALKNSTFRKIFTTPSHSTAATNKHPNGITFRSTMFKKMKSTSVNGGKILGGKTGYTDEAGLCLASLAQVDGKEYIFVTAGAKTGGTPAYNISDACEVYNEIDKS